MREFKHLKSFESFFIRESESGTTYEKDLKQKIENLSDEERKKLETELVSLSNKLGLELEEMKDPKRVAETISKKQGDLKLDPSVNEGAIKDWWGKVKNKFSNWLTKIGIGGMILSIATTAIGSEIQSGQTQLADFVRDSTVDPNTAVIIGGVAFVISVAATVIGTKGQQISK